jgi:hypothetical protein
MGLAAPCTVPNWRRASRRAMEGGLGELHVELEEKGRGR